LKTDGPKSLLQRAGVNVAGLNKAVDDAVGRLPTVTGQEQVQPGPELMKLLQQATGKEAIKRKDEFIASEMFLLALSDAKGAPTLAAASRHSGERENNLLAATKIATRLCRWGAYTGATFKFSPSPRYPPHP